MVRSGPYSSWRSTGDDSFAVLTDRAPNTQDARAREAEREVFTLVRSTLIDVQHDLNQPVHPLRVAVQAAGVDLEQDLHRVAGALGDVLRRDSRVELS